MSLRRHFRRVSRIDMLEPLEPYCVETRRRVLGHVRGSQNGS